MYQHIHKWIRPSNYFGQSWPDWYIVITRHRDSDLLSNHNFDKVYAELNALPDTDVNGETSLQIVRENHWAVGWVEWVAVHESDTVRLDKADELKSELADYPILDEDSYSEKVSNAAVEYWESLSIKDRLREFEEYFVNCFQARHPLYQQSDRLYDRIRDLIES